MNPGYGYSDAQFSLPVEIGVSYSATVLNISVISGTGQMIARSKLRDELQTILSYYKSKYNVGHIPIVQAKAGHALKLMCQVEMSNPKPELEWQLHHCSPVQFASIMRGINDTINDMKSQNDPYDAFFKSCQNIHLTGNYYFNYNLININVIKTDIFQNNLVDPKTRFEERIVF